MGSTPWESVWLGAQAGDLHGSLGALQDSLGLSVQLSEASGDVDVLGAIGDVYADLGDLERAGQVRWVALCGFPANARHVAVQCAAAGRTGPSECPAP